MFTHPRIPEAPLYSIAFPTGFCTEGTALVGDKRIVPMSGITPFPVNLCPIAEWLEWTSPKHRACYQHFAMFRAFGHDSAIPKP